MCAAPILRNIVQCGNKISIMHIQINPSFPVIQGMLPANYVDTANTRPAQFQHVQMFAQKYNKFVHLQWRVYILTSRRQSRGRNIKGHMLASSSSARFSDEIYLLRVSVHVWCQRSICINVCAHIFHVARVPLLALARFLFAQVNNSVNSNSHVSALRPWCPALQRADKYYFSTHMF